MNGNSRTILENCIVIAFVCFIMGFIVKRTHPVFPQSDMTIISEIESLKNKVEIEENLRVFQKRLISDKEKEIQEESDENKRLMSYAEKKCYEKSLKKTELEIFALNKKIEKNYKKLWKRHPEFKESCDEKLSIDFAEN
ncbi:MAG: hypothetical protein IKO39_01695 [Treponema sp.]|nr:hypothetical protein [Treponema sp.]